MDYCKMYYDEVFLSDMTEVQIGVLLKLKILTAQLEKIPTDIQIRKHIHYKSLNSFQGWLNERSITIQQVVNDTLKDAQRCVNKRGAAKINYIQHKASSDILPVDYQQTSEPDKIRLEEIKEDNINTTADAVVEELENNLETENPEIQNASVGEIQKPLKPHQELVNTWKLAYKQQTGLDYLDKKSDFINMASLLKDNPRELVEKKANIYYDWCKNKKIWFTKGGMADFTIGKFYSHWNEILEGVENNGKQNGISQRDIERAMQMCQ